MGSKRWEHACNRLGGSPNSGPQTYSNLAPVANPPALTDPWTECWAARRKGFWQAGYHVPCSATGLPTFASVDHFDVEKILELAWKGALQAAFGLSKGPFSAKNAQDGGLNTFQAKSDWQTVRFRSIRRFELATCILTWASSQADPATPHHNQYFFFLLQTVWIKLRKILSGKQMWLPWRQQNTMKFQVSSDKAGLKCKSFSAFYLRSRRGTADCYACDIVL